MTGGQSTDSATRRQWIHGAAKQLTEGDRVAIRAGNKTRTLTVTDGPHEVEREPYRCDGFTVALEGYGTTYKLEVPSPEYDRGTLLHYPSAEAIGLSVRDISRADGDAFGIVAGQTAEDMGIPDR